MDGFTVTERTKTALKSISDAVIDAVTMQSGEKVSVFTIANNGVPCGVMIAINFSLCGEEELAKFNEALKVLKHGNP